MVRITGSVKDENSLSSPTDEVFTSVVRRSNGKSAKRISGTESSVPTKNEPRASNTPRKDRLLSTCNPDGEGLGIVFSECPAGSNMRFLDCQSQVTADHGIPRPIRRACQVGYFLFARSRM